MGCDVAVVGIGSVGFGRFEDSSVATIANGAVTAALDDCGLERRQIDGLFPHVGNPRGLDYDELANLLALEVNYASQPWAHGRFGATVIGQAVMALSFGLVDYALCVGAWRPPGTLNGAPDSLAFDETRREGGGPHAENPYTGMAAPIAGAAMSLRIYLERYGVEREQLGAVAVAQRNAAQHNPQALMGHKAMTRADYARSRPIVEPLRLFDCSVPSGAGVAMILTRTDRARALRQTPIHVRGFQGIHAGPNQYIFGQPGLGMYQAEVYDYQPLGADEPVYRQAGVTPSDIQSLHCYDGFAPQVWWTLERFGFCGPGEAPDFTDDGRIELTGELPVNTSGGHLSEGHSNGWGATAEIIRQLRGHAGPRQIPNISLAQWATTLGDSLIYGTEPS